MVINYLIHTYLRLKKAPPQKKNIKKCFFYNFWVQPLLSIVFVDIYYKSENVPKRCKVAKFASIKELTVNFPALTDVLKEKKVQRKLLSVEAKTSNCVF